MAMEIDPVSARAARAKTDAQRTEREANEAITKAQKRVKDAEVEAQNAIEQQRDRYERRAMGEAAVAEARIDNLKQNNYEQLRAAKQQADLEIMRLKRESEKQATTTKETYEQITQQTARAGETKLKDTTAKNWKAFESEQKHALDQTETLRNQHAQSLMNLQNEQDIQIKHIQNEAGKVRKTLQEKTLSTAEQDQLDYALKYESALEGHKRAYETLNADAKASLDAKKLDYQRKLTAYSNSRSDPFYQPVTVGAKLTEKDDHFVITAQIPENEQAQVSVTMKGDKELVIAGHRRAEESLVKDGKTQKTSSYQTYSESIPLHWPVDSRGMTREWNGDQIIVRIPKLTYDNSAPKRPKTATNARLERPQFPKDLPTEAQLAKGSDTDISSVSVQDPSKKPSKRVFNST